MNIINLIISLVSGAVGGNLAGAAMKDKSLGTAGNSVAGIFGGGIGGAILQALGVGTGAGAGGVDLASIVGNILSGGVGRYQHFCDGLLLDGVTGASTANIYNFIVGGLSRARAHIVSQGIPMAGWDFGLGALKGSALAGEARAAAAGAR